MPKEATAATAEKLVAHCRAGTERQALEDLYAADAVSIEAAAMGESGPEARGLEAINAKHDWWESAMQVNSQEIAGPFLHGDDRFALIFDFDTTEKSSGRRSQMREVAIYTVDPAGKISREEFYYA